MEANKAQQISHVSQLFVIQENNEKINKKDTYLSSFGSVRFTQKLYKLCQMPFRHKTKCLKSIIHVHAFNTNQNNNTKMESFFS